MFALACKDLEYVQMILEHSNYVKMILKNDTS